MAKVRLTNRPLNGRAMRINFGTDRYVVGYKQDVDIPLRYASSLLRDDNYTVVLDSNDEKDLATMSKYKRSHLVGHYDKLTEDDDGPTMVEKIFGKSKSFFGGKAKPKPEKLPEAKEEIHPQMEKPVKEEKEVLAPLPPNLEKLTNKQLKALLDERGIKADGKKSILIDALLEAEG